MLPDAASRYRLLLEMAESVNSRLRFIDVLEAILESLHSVVPFGALGVATFTSSGELVLHEIHIRGMKRSPVESWQEQASKVTGNQTIDLDKLTPIFNHPDSAVRWVAKTRTTHFADPSENRFVDEPVLVELGVRSYMRVPLIVRGEMIGILELFRSFLVNPESKPFTQEEADFVTEVSGPIATAVANSLAYEEITRLKNALQNENTMLREVLDDELMFGEIVGSSKALRKVLSSIEKVAPTDATVLVTGETGTGKELIARAIHRRSPRALRTLIKVNCAALPQNLIASELFGHERGAFTGALQRRLGRFELARGGTIFLDEIGELPLDMQVALLRVLQEGEFERVGGSQTIKTDARVVAATNRDLPTEIAAGRFRSDLFYRLNVFPVHVPALRERREDIPILVEYFAAQHGARLGRKFRRIDRATMELLSSYDWPGNVRELENVMERAAILAEGDRITVDPTLLTRTEASRPMIPLKRDLDTREREAIESALAECRGRVSGPDGAAVRLGIRATTLDSKIKKYGIDKFRFRRHEKS